MGSNKESFESKTPPIKLGWSFWMLMLLIGVVTKLFGLVGGLVAWGLWSLVAFLINKGRT